ncbi:hemerythrin domain-containing protein [Parafrankia elaeagni]|uniref:hemerythrin domain-containing protein n=1 Tax=Parafrankia elaeagni TaxID=222534 RepID=UPI0003739285|nr:hemerythrin domain-containing protein [Parafrankia elaeagni]
MAKPTAYLLIHDAIRLELRRLADVTSELADGRRVAGPAQLVALRDHVNDVLDVLHHHHVGEDDYLWPLLRDLGLPADGLATLSADHEQLDLLIQRLRTGLAGLAGGDRGAVGALATVTGTLHSLMDEHLAVEESLVVPAIESMITDAELARLEKRMSRDSTARMSFALPWVAEAGPDRMAEVVGGIGPLLPALLAVSRAGYRRRLGIAYGALVAEPGPVRLRGAAEIVIPAPVEEVYAAVSDVRRMAGYSPECYRCEWLDGASGPVVGARFQGWNRFRGFRWSRECEIVTADPGRMFAFRTRRTSLRPDSTLWRFELREHAAGTHVSQTFELSAGAVTMLFERVSGRETSTPAAMLRTLERVRDDLARVPVRI